MHVRGTCIDQCQNRHHGLAVTICVCASTIATTAARRASHTATAASCLTMVAPRSPTVSAAICARSQGSRSSRGRLIVTGLGAVAQAGNSSAELIAELRVKRRVSPRCGLDGID